MAGDLINLELHFAGPYSLLGAERSVFTAPEAASPGVYLWVIPSRTEPGWISYVGETTKPFALRFGQHLAAQFSGRSPVYDLEELREGSSTAEIWPPRDRGRDADHLREFVSSGRRLREPVRAYLEASEVMLGALDFDLVRDPELECTKRIESAFLALLRKQDELVVEMVKGNRCRDFGRHDCRLRVTMTTARPLRGFPEEPLDA